MGNSALITRISAFIVLLLALSACDNLVELSAQVSPTFTPQSVGTTTPSQEPASTVPLTATPSLHPTSIPTRTPAPPAECPPSKPNLEPDFSLIDFNIVLDPDYENEILDFLNRGGTGHALVSHEWNLNPFYAFKSIREMDLTSDSVPEIIVAGEGPKTMIFGCKAGAYLKLYEARISSGMMRASEISEVSDINHNGVAEVVITTRTCNGGCTDVQVLEWNGETFNDLLNWHYPYLKPSDRDLEALQDLVITDIDGDSISEIILEDGAPLGNLAAYVGGYPWRNKSFVFKWDMTQYSIIRFEFEPPYYRFEALYDGDQATLTGDFDKALSSYEQAIFDETLEWWSYERWKYVDSWQMSNYGGIHTPTPLSPDQDVDTNLIAYAWYRIMLVHSIQGSMGDAQAAYDTLKVEYGLGMNGYIFTQMAAIFWEEFESSGGVAEACQEVNSFALGHSEEIGIILPNYYQDLVEKICPFG